MVRSELGRRVAALCLVGLALQVAPMGAVLGVARAAQKPSVVLIPLTPLEGVSAQTAQRISDALVAELAGKPSQLSLLGSGASTSQAAGPNPQVKALFEEGKAHLADLSFERAATALRNGLGLSRTDAAHAELESILEAHVNLAVALFRKGEEKEAQDSLLSVVRLSPDYTLAEGRFPPVFVREFQKARKRAQSLSTASVRIEGPRGATAYVDGRDLGMVPLEEEGLRQGAHYVQVVGAAGEKFGQLVEVSGGKVTVKAQFSDASSAKAVALAIAPEVDASLALKLQGIAKSTGADSVIIGVVQKAGEGYLIGTGVYGRSGHTVQSLDPAKLESLGQLSSSMYLLGGRLAERVTAPASGQPLPVALLPSVRAAVIARAGGPSDTPVREHVLVQPGDGELRKLDRTSVLDGAPAGGEKRGSEVSSGIPWWVWVAGGVGVAAVAGGTAYGLSQASRPVTGTVTARW